MEEFKNNGKFQSTVTTAKELFWKFGIKKTSIEEVCQKAPVSKMTFYKFFKNKETLAEYILKEILDEWHNKYRQIMVSDIPFIHKIEKLITLEQTASNDISEEFIEDIYNNEFTELQALINNNRANYNKEIVKDMVEAQQKGEIRQDIKPEFILYLLEDIGNKILDKKISKLYKTKQELIMELANHFFYGIMNINN